MKGEGNEWERMGKEREMNGKGMKWKGWERKEKGM